MKSVKLLTLTLAGALLAHSAVAGMKPGDVNLKSIGPIAFAPEGVLLVSDPKAATIYAIATSDSKAAGKIDVAKVNLKIAALLGTSPDQVLINDMAVNPVSRNAYLAVSRGRGADAAPAIIRVGAGGKLSKVSLQGVKMSKAVLPDPPADKMMGSGRRAKNPRTESITDIAFTDGRVVVAGLANEEFASTLRAIPFPFAKVGKATEVEIFHGAHGRFDTRSPIRTFVPFTVENEPNLLAAYTCTPLVNFPVADLKPAAKIMGSTIAELGNRNRPLDMIVYRQNGKDFLLIANSSRGIMKVTTDDLGSVKPIKDRISGGGTAGLKYETVKAWQGVDQLDKLDDKLALIVRREGDAMSLETLPLP